MNNSSATAVQTAAQLSSHLKSLRKARGLTQAALGERIGVKQVRIADIERNPGAISVLQLIEILHALDARMLLADTASPAQAPSPKAAERPARW